MFYVVDAGTWRRLVWIGALSFTAGVLAVTSSWPHVERSADSMSSDAGVPVMATGGAGEVDRRAAETAAANLAADPEGAHPVSSEEVRGAQAAAQGGVVIEPAAVSLQRFITYRIERERARSARIETLEALLQDDAAAPDVQAELLRLLQRAELEAQAEGLLRAEGVRDAVVVLSDAGASVVVSDVLDRAQAARLGELVARVTQTPKERITIADGENV